MIQFTVFKSTIGKEYHSKQNISNYDPVKFCDNLKNVDCCRVEIPIKQDISKNSLWADFKSCFATLHLFLSEFEILILVNG